MFRLAAIGRSMAAESFMVMKNPLNLLSLKKSGTIVFIGPMVDIEENMNFSWRVAANFDKSLSK
jgi:beta-glucosidase-like glycosyl hydrolase